MGPLPTGQSLLVVVDHYSQWMGVDILTNTSSRAVLTCLEKHFARYGFPGCLRTGNAANLDSQEMEEFLAEHGARLAEKLSLVGQGLKGKSSAKIELC